MGPDDLALIEAVGQPALRVQVFKGWVGGHVAQDVQRIDHRRQIRVPDGIARQVGRDLLVALYMSGGAGDEVLVAKIATHKERAGGQGDDHRGGNGPPFGDLVAPLDPVIG